MLWYFLHSLLVISVFDSLLALFNCSSLSKDHSAVVKTLAQKCAGMLGNVKHHCSSGLKRIKSDLWRKA